MPLSQLRYLQVTYRDFEGEDRLGELIVHYEVSREIVEIFKQLYQAGYPIRKMVPVSHYRGSDWHSIEADNSSAFNCRKVAGTDRWSKHAYGKAIDINPLENPYISYSGKITHQASLKYRSRVHNVETPEDQAVLLREDEVVKLFKSYGWKWGGDWRTIKDYQHFEK